MANLKFFIFLTLWYIFSCATLFMNKYVLSSLDGNPFLLSSFQLILCAICGFNQMIFFSMKNNDLKKIVINFNRKFILVGSLRYLSLAFGLIALWYVEVSFAETVKSTAPLFTVIISRFILHENTNLIQNLTLIPIMMGLAMCTAYEISFTLIGFLASLLTNLCECFQNVYSKKLLSDEKIDPEEMQFYTSFSSLLVQFPIILILVDLPISWNLFTKDSNLIIAFVLDGVLFHLQSLTEYFLLIQIESVTHSIANTCKRAFLIWMSVIFYGNKITLISLLGTLIIIIGVLMFNKSKSMNSKISKNNSKNILHLI